MTFDEGDITSGAGAPLLRRLGDRLGLNAALASVLRDWRNPIVVLHTCETGQCVTGAAGGTETVAHESSTP